MALSKLKAKIKGIKYLPFEQDGISYNLYNLPKGFVIKGNLYLSHKGLTELPDLSEVVVKGDFNCSGNQLTSLEGAPKEVGGSFYCSNNQLTSLVGLPQMKESKIIYCDDALGNKYGLSSVFSYKELCASPVYKSETAMNRIRSKLPQENIETKPVSTKQQEKTETKTKQQEAFEKINAEFSQWLKDNSIKPTRE